MTEITTRTMLERAARGVGKIDTYGHRGVTDVSAEEIEAMALTLSLLGLRPICPGTVAPAELLAPDAAGMLRIIADLAAGKATP